MCLTDQIFVNTTKLKDAINSKENEPAEVYILYTNTFYFLSSMYV